MNESLSNPLTLVQRGMAVYSSEGDEVGVVEVVYWGKDAGVDLNENARSTEHEAFPEVIQPDDLPPEMIERMLDEGYIRVTRPGLDESGSVVFAEQIDSVSEEGVYLVPS